MKLIINTVAGRVARWIGHHADLFVVANGFEIAARLPRQCGALQCLPGELIGHTSKPLESVVDTEPILFFAGKRDLTG